MLWRTVKGEAIAGLLLWLLTFSPLLQAQPSFETDSVGPQRFIAAHGRNAVIMGYASGGLELWAYPLQLISGYELGFRAAGETSEINGITLLRRITYDAQAVTRTYIGADFIVHERLFVPLNEQAIFLSYTVECRHSIDVVVHFKPVLDLMWPASLGGQNTHWDAAASAYVLGEGTNKYQAFIGSPGILTHDQVLNSAQPGMAAGQLAFAVRAGEANQSATVVVARGEKGASTEARLRNLLASETRLEDEARAHYRDLPANALRIETPDSTINRQLAWAQIALDQAWVCEELLGCGLVAGYGPSRAARRPQYDWFFAGDGLVAVNALVDIGNYDRAREELSFIAKYQDPGTGMIWHELSQSADPAEWATKYPYMFVHVDITFQYLIAVEHYFAASGDRQFVQQNWRGLENAYHYCVSLLNGRDGLPRIPSTKEGGNEQDRMTDDLNLSTSWVDASAAVAHMARQTGRAQLAEEAMQRSDRAKQSVTHRYWDDQRNSWIDGYDGVGGAVFRRSADGVALVRILDQRRSGSILDQIASSGFQTDWGTRGEAASSPRFDPNSYASGSVSALGTSEVASAFWAEHRPSTAFSLWSALVPWGTLDSIGHMHEVVTGDFYRQQIESVPEQTWSSAGFLSSATHGFVGLERAALDNRLNFAPHLPAAWDRMSISNIQVAGGNVAMTVVRVPAGLELQIENTGAPLDLSFAPEIPLGARLHGASLDGQPVAVRPVEYQQDTHAALSFRVGRGKTGCLIRYEGGISLDVKDPLPLVGDSSRGVKIVSVTHSAQTLTLTADVPRAGNSSIIELRTNEKPIQVHGAELIALAPGDYQLIVDHAPAADTVYQQIEIMVKFAPFADAEH